MEDTTKGKPQPLLVVELNEALGAVLGIGAGRGHNHEVLAFVTHLGWSHLNVLAIVQRDEVRLRRHNQAAIARARGSNPNTEALNRLGGRVLLDVPRRVGEAVAVMAVLQLGRRVWPHHRGVGVSLVANQWQYVFESVVVVARRNALIEVGMPVGVQQWPCGVSSHSGGWQQ